MKIAISASDNTSEAQIDPRFGRCPYFAIIEIDEQNNEIKNENFIKNEALEQSRGAGINASEFIGNQEVRTVITKNMGPKAFSVMQQLDIEVYQAEGSIKQAIKDLLDEKLEKMSQSNGPTFINKN